MKEKTMRSFRRTSFCAVLSWIFAGTCLAFAQAQPGKQLNNLVIEYANISSFDRGGTRTNFEHPHLGWVFFRLTSKQADVEEVRVSIQRKGEEFKEVCRRNVTDKTASVEAMLYLPAGEYTVLTQVTGTPTIERLIVRAIPELMHAFFGQRTFIPEFGAYDRSFLGKYLDPNINCLLVHERVLQLETGRSDLEKWKQSGRRILAHGGIPGSGVNSTDPIEKAAAYWHDHAGMQNPLFDGIAVDEFWGGSDDSGYTAKYSKWAEALNEVYSDKQVRDRRFYPYTGSRSLLNKPESTRFADTVIQHDGRVMLEYYFSEKPTEAAMDQTLKLFKDELDQWQTTRRGSARNLVAVFSIMSGPWTCDLDPSVDFKVLMDKEMNLIANHPSALGLGGVQYWNVGYSTEENVRWMGQLYRHYGIEGKRTMLSDEYGYRYQLDHIRNPDFASGLEGWEAEPAEPKSVTTGQRKAWGWLQGRYTGDGWYAAKGTAIPKIGDTFLLTKRSATKPNRVRQTIRNLVPGNLYSLSLNSADFDHIKDGISDRNVPRLKVELDGIEMLHDRSFDSIVGSPNSHGPFQFTWTPDSKSAWVTYHYRVFRAKDKTATLTISDWPNGDNGPIGKQIMTNGVQVQPYFDRVEPR